MVSLQRPCRIEGLGYFPTSPVSSKDKKIFDFFQQRNSYRCSKNTDSYFIYKAESINAKAISIRFTS